jgi:hypothetical protein
MSFWNKILAGLIGGVSIVFLLVAVRAMKIHQYWGNLSNAYEFFMQKDDDICQAIAFGGEIPLTLEEGPGPGKLREFYKQYQYTLPVNAETKWNDFVKAVIKAAADTGQFDRRLVEACAFKKDQSKGLERAQATLAQVLDQRGRAWNDITAETIDEKTGQVTATNGLPERQGLAERLVVYIFDKEKQEDKRSGKLLNYLGKFVVESIVEREKQTGQATLEKQLEVLVQLKPAQILFPKELARLKESTDQNKAGARNWVMYERLPRDGHELFAAWSDEEKEKILPKQTVAQFIHDNQPATWADLEKWGVPGMVVTEVEKEVKTEDGTINIKIKVPMLTEDGKKMPGVTGIYQRPLREYQTLLDTLDIQRIRVYDLIAGTQRDTQLAQRAAREAEAERLIREKDKESITASRDQGLRDRNAVLGHYKAVEQKVRQFTAEVNRLMAANRTLAQQVSDVQYRALELIDSQSRSMAQSSDGH